MTLDSGPYLRAGAHQFASLWTRDFCFSIEGLLKLGHADIVKNHLEKLILARRKSDNLIPRSLDSIATPTRVFLESLIKYSPPIKDPLKAEFEGEHGTLAIDSNLLVLRGTLLYFKYTGDDYFQKFYASELKQLFDFYNKYFNHGLIIQPKFSDWQDSVKRTGSTFLTNYLYWETGSNLNQYFKFMINAQTLSNLKKLLWKRFYSPNEGLFKSLKGSEQISLEGNLFALLNSTFWNAQADRTHSYKSLKHSKLWTGFGLATFPNYPLNQMSWTTMLVGLRHYHDNMLWSWLQGLSLKLAKHMNDKEEANKLEGKLDEILLRDFMVKEIFKPDSLLPFKKPFYRAEGPFSWGAAMIIDATSI